MAMNDYGLVSIVMPSYNSEKYIKDSIESVLNQTYPHWELLIVDDCSMDKTVEIVGNFKDERIKLFQNEVNSGAAISRNWALREASGEWIAFLDSDDLWLPTKLEEQLRFMVKNNSPFTFTDYCIFENNSLHPYIITGPGIINKRAIYKYCYCFTSTVMYNKKEIGLIQISNLKKNNDYAMWLKALQKNSGLRINRCLSIYVRHTGSISSGRKYKLIKWHYRLFKNEMGHSSFASALFTIRNLWFGLWKKIVYKIKMDKDSFEVVTGLLGIKEQKHV